MSRKKPNRQGAKKPNYGKNKKAFDAIMQAYRDMATYDVKIEWLPKQVLPKETALIYDIAVRSSEKCGSVLNGNKATRNPAQPSPIDFKADVELILRRVPDELAARFSTAYIAFDSIDSIEIEVHADKTMGAERHRLEQKLGAEFIRKGLYPVSKYFTVERKWREN